MFENFLSDMGERPPGKTIERIDNAGDYAPGNCRWVTSKEQARNRRTNVVIEFNGRTMILTDWAKEFGLTPEGLSWRLKHWGKDRTFSRLAVPV